MNIIEWSVLIGIAVIGGLPLLFKSHRTEKNINIFLKIIGILSVVTILILYFNFHFAIAYFIGIFLYIVFDKNTYTKKRLIIYGSIVAVLVIAFFMIFRDNPEYTLKHLADNPETTSLYVNFNDEEVVDYQADIPRPLASVVKIMVAIEYAYQIDDGTLAKDESVSLDELDRYYIKDTDGGAHPSWIERMKEEHQIENNEVSLHNVAKGMITESSNANTEYLIHLLGMENINDRIHELGLTDHDDIYPLNGAMLMPHHFKQEDDPDWLDEYRDMPDEEYKKLAMDLSEKLVNDEFDLDEAIEFIAEEDRVWSDRLPGASAATYGDVLQMIQNEDFPDDVAMIVRELMEWPMEMVPANKDEYNYLGSKGGSTDYIYNQAMYAENLDGDQLEIVLLIDDDLSSWKSFMLSIHSSSFIVKMINDEDFLEKVEEELTSK